MSMADRISRIERLRTNDNHIGALTDDQVNALVLADLEYLAGALGPSAPDWLDEALTSFRSSPRAEVSQNLRAAVREEHERTQPHYDQTTDAQLLKKLEMVVRDLLALTPHKGSARAEYQQ
jgi:hypothetical protein